MKNFKFRHTARLSADANGKPIEIIRTGAFTHERIGRFEVTEEMIDQMVHNFVDLNEADRIMVDYNHASMNDNPEESKAAGWVQNIFKQEREEGDGFSLMGEVRWTEEAQAFIANEEFRYISIEMAFNDVNVETGQAIGTHMLAVGLVNRPFIPNMAPVELSQIRDLSANEKIELNVLKLAKGSLKDHIDRVVRAFYSTFPDSFNQMFFVQDIFEDSIIVEEFSDTGSRLFEVRYSLTKNDNDEEVVEFEGQNDWREGQMVFEVMAAREIGSGEPFKKNSTENKLKKIVSNKKSDKTRIKMDEQKIRELFGWDEGTDVSEALLALKATMEESAKLQEKIDTLETQIAELKAAKEEAEQASTQLSDKEKEVVQLNTAIDTANQQVETLSARLQELENDKTQREAVELMDRYVKEGRALPAEFAKTEEGEESPMREMAFSNVELFKRIMESRPASFASLQMEVSHEKSEEPKDAETQYYEALEAKRQEHPDWEEHQLRSAVFEDNPNLKKVIYAEA